MSSSTSQTTTNRQQLYRLTFAILNTNSLHFITISLLFLPLTITAVKFYSSITSATTEGDHPFNLLLTKTIITFSQNLLTLKTLITILTFTCFVILPTTTGVALITYSTNQAIHHKPLTVFSTVKSLVHSYIPLLNTIFTGLIIIFILIFTCTLSSLAITKTIQSLGFDSNLFVSTFINSLFSYSLAILITFFLVVWGSASGITILESKSGFQTLRQSANQSTEFRRHSFSLVFITIFTIYMSLRYASISQNNETISTWIWILRLGVVYLEPVLMILMYVVANTVLYVQCKVEASDEEASKTVVDGLKELSNGGFSYMLYLCGVAWIILLCWEVYGILLLMNKYS